MKFKHLLFTFIAGAAIPLSVNAATVSISGGSTIKSGVESYYDIVLSEGSGSANQVCFTPSIDTSKVTLSYEKVSNTIVEDIKPNQKNCVTAVGNSLPDGTIIKLILKNVASQNDNTELKISGINYGTENNISEVSKSISLKYVTTTKAPATHTSAKLSNITVSSGTLSPAFTPNTYGYKLNIDNDLVQKVTIKPSCAESGCVPSFTCTAGCTVDQSNPYKLALVQGKNEATLSVTSQDGSNTEEYTFIIYRGETTDGSSSLSSLGIQDFELNEKFDKDKLDYSATVDYEHETIVVNALAEDPNADIQIKGDTKLIVGENVVTITVTSAETGDKKIYNIKVHRKDFKEGMSTTKGLLLDNTKKKSNTKTILIIVLAVVGLGIIGASAYFIFFKNKKGKGKKGLITKDEELNKAEDEKTKELDVKDNELEDDVTVIEDMPKPSIDDALTDLMQTRELEFPEKLK